MQKQLKSAQAPGVNCSEVCVGEPLVTVVIPTHNRVELLGRAIESVQAQTFSKLDIVVVDDASDDGTQDLMSGISDERIRYIRHPRNEGGSAARNTGIAVARGEFIAFLDDDDVWKPGKIKTQLAHIREHDVVICGYTLHSGKRELRGTPGDGRSFAIKEDMLRRGFVGWGMSTLLARTECFSDIRFDNTLPVGQDWDLVIRLANRYKLRYVDDPLVSINIAPHGRITTRMVSAPMEQIEDRMAVLRKHREFLGSFWFRYHEARMLLYRVRDRQDRWKLMLYAIRRCGITPVLSGLIRNFFVKIVGYRY